MQSRYVPIAILTGVLFVTALVGYLIPEDSDGPPMRVLLENKAGKVLFTHTTHLEMQDQNCISCHHTSGDDKTPPKCSTCHVRKFDEVFIADHQNRIDEKQCVSCHHPSATIAHFSHDAHAGDYAQDDCQACHHDETIEPEPQACSNCHEQEGTETMLSLRKANHTRCADCHDDLYAQGVTGCGNCHVRKMTKGETPEPKPCSSCHEEPLDVLIPTTTVAYHDQCRGCHEEQDSGPFGDDACYQCHMK